MIKKGLPLIAIWACSLGLALVVLAQTARPAAAQEISLPGAQLASGPGLETLTRIGAETSRVVAVHDRYVYVNFNHNLLTFDVSDPSRPKAIADSRVMSDTFYDMAIAGSYAYLVGEAGLHVVDMSDPLHLTPLTSLGFGSAIQRVTLAGAYAYAVGAGGLYVIDVSNPTSPTLAATYQPTVTLQDVAIVGDYAYLAWKRTLVGQFPTGGLRILSIADALHPVAVGDYTIEGSWYGFEGKRIIVAGPYAYLSIIRYDDDDAGKRSYLLYTLDVSAPTSPTYVSSCGDLGTLDDVVLNGQQLYTAGGKWCSPDDPGWARCENEGKVCVLDLSTPAQPTLQHCAVTPDVARSLTVMGDQTYVAAGWAGLQVFDVSNPSEMVRAGAYDLPDDGFVVDIEISGSYAYVLDDHAFHTLDVSASGRPLAVNNYPLQARDVAIVGDYAYLIGQAAGDPFLSVLNLSDPMRPTSVGEYHPGPIGDLPDSPMAIAAQGKHAYVTTYTDGVRILDISNPRGVIEAAVYRTDLLRWGSTVKLAGNLMYLSGSQVEIVDVSDPTSPTQGGRIPLASSCVEPVGRYALVCLDESVGKAVALIDLSDVAHPAQLGWYSGSKPFVSVAVAGQYAYVADHSTGLHVLDLSDSLHLRLAATYALPVRSSPLLVSGDRIYSGLNVLRLTGAEFVSGYVKDWWGRPLPGAWISNQRGLGAVSDARGLYTTHLISGAHTLTPVLSGYAFWPPTRSVSLPGQASGLDFIALQTASVSVTLAPVGTAWLTQTLTYTDPQGLPTQLTFLPKVVSQTTTIVFTPTLVSAPGEQVFAGHAFDLAAYRGGKLLPTFAFSRPVPLSLRYSHADIHNVASEDQLALFWWNGSGWSPATETCTPASVYQRDLTNNSLSLAICRTGGYGLFGPTHRIYLPLVTRQHAGS